MRIGIVIYSNDPETVWNAFRFGKYALKEDNQVKIFLLGKGVECESIDTEKFGVNEQIKSFVESSGEIYACGTCLKIRHMGGSGNYPLSMMKGLYEIIKGSDKIVTF